jgi:hypothetical protein
MLDSAGDPLVSAETGGANQVLLGKAAQTVSNTQGRRQWEIENRRVDIAMSRPTRRKLRSCCIRLSLQAAALHSDMIICVDTVLRDLDGEGRCGAQC